ncbi:MAG: HEAT repeat domain-containing protein [Planctomycetes bacterium]|nr:HEAT repeat domain-containing protein [Planctomycetota bacterium]
MLSSTARGLVALGVVASAAFADSPTRAVAPVGAAARSLSTTTRDPATGRAVDPELKSTVDRLRQQLRDGNRERKEDAAGDLAKLGVAAVPLLLEAYDASVAPESTWLTWVLRDIGDERAIDAFVRKLPASNSDLQSTILESLGNFDDPRVPQAAARVATSGHGDARRAAYRLLAERPDSTSTPIFLRGLRDADSWVREASEDGLRAAIARRESVFSPFSNLLSSADDDAAEPILRLLALTKDPKAPARIETALSRERPETRRTAIQSLVWLGDVRSGAAIQKLLDDSDCGVRREAINALARLGTRTAFRGIVDRLRDPIDDVRIAAHDALAALTHQDLGMKPADWLTWWATAER